MIIFHITIFEQRIFASKHYSVVLLLFLFFSLPVSSQATSKKLLKATRSGEADRVRSIIKQHSVSPDRPIFENGQPITPLHIACKRGSQQIVSFFLSRGASTEAAGGQFAQTPLFYAVRNGHHNVVRLLLRHDAKVQASDYNGTTPIMLAAERGQSKIVQTLLKSEADPQAKNKHGTSVLMFAASSGRKDIVSLLLERGAKVHHRNKDGISPLMRAESGEVARLFIQNGAEIKAQDQSGKTPLMYAAERGAHGVVKQLLKHGADLNRSDQTDRTPFIHAAEEGHPDVFAYLLDTGKIINEPSDGLNQKQTAAVRSIQNGHFQVVKELKKDGFNLNQPLQTGSSNETETLLSLMSSEGRTKAVRFLIRHGVDVNSSEVYHPNPLSSAVSSGQESIVKLLINNGVQVRRRGDSVVTPLQQGCGYYCFEAATFMIKDGGRINISDKKLTPGISNANEEVLRLLVENGASITRKTDSGTSPLITASMCARPEVVKFLLKKGAKVNAMNGNGWTPLRAASAGGRKKIVRILLKAGSRVAEERERGKRRSAIQIARQHGHDNILELLRTMPEKIKQSYLQEVAKRHPKPTLKSKIKEAIQQLGARDYATREKAEKKILREGPEVLPIILNNENIENPEIRKRIKNIKQELIREGVRQRYIEQLNEGT